jgi:asparagine synthase (glutamine-hydrolysing)
MCGIAGVIDVRNPPARATAAVERMCAAMVHRGPDDVGLAAFPTGAIGMRRLAIFDPANGRQPMRTPDGRVTLVFNGAIYNFRELRRELEATGWTFHTECDTEVLLAAYARWGSGCVRRLRGMFAFAAWDEREQSLFLARDPFGIKPLYYRETPGGLEFASELNALLAAGTGGAEIDQGALHDFLGWLAVPAPRTIYRGIHSLEPGYTATLAGGRLTLASTWSFREIPAPARICTTREEFTREFRARLEDTIRAHVIADVPVGAFLSGGLDSTVVVGLMSRLTGAKLRTFSIVFDEARFSEADAAATTARHFGTEHTPARLTGSDVARDLGDLIATLDQPTADGINTYYASQAARRGGVTVALSGLGGDEIAGGYSYFYSTPKIARWLPFWRTLPAPLRRAVVARLNQGDTRRRKLADILGFARDLPEVAALQRRVFSDATGRALLSPDLRRDAIGGSPFHPQLARLQTELAGAGSFETISAWELSTYMADVLLRDSDVMSMRHSLELRVPFVDRPLIEWLWHQPSEFKNTPAQPKSALAAATADLLPPGLTDRPKQGFTLPFAVWMKRELRPFLDETFSAASVGHSGFFDANATAELWQRFLAGDDLREWSRVWSLAIAIAFVNRPQPGRA